MPGPAGTRTVVIAAETVDALTSPQLRDVLVRPLDSGQVELVLDDGVPGLDSTAPGVLVGASSPAHARGEFLRLVCTQQRLLRIFAITGLMNVFPFHASDEEALAADVVAP